MSFDLGVVPVLFDPFVEGLFYVVMLLCPVWACVACEAVVGMGVEWLGALCPVVVVLAWGTVGV